MASISEYSKAALKSGDKALRNSAKFAAPSHMELLLMGSTIG